MPFLCVATSQAARNQVRRPRWLPWSTVPAVTETCRAQAAHCRVNRSRLSSQPLSCPQAGQRKPSGQRFSSSQRAQAASSGNLASNSGSDRGSSVIHPPPVCSGTTYSPTGARGMSHFGQTRNCLDALEIMDQGQTLLCNLEPRKGFPPASAKLLGRLLINELTQTALNHRVADKSRPHIL